MQKELFSVKIERMQTADIEQVIAIEEEAYGNHHWSRESFFNELSNQLAKYYSAFNEQGALIGYAGSWEIVEEAHITNIAVSKKYRRHHVGEALLTRIIDECKKSMVKYITLEVRVGNTAAISLYEKYGFHSLGMRKGYYQDNNEDALIMWTENLFYDKFKSNYEEKVDVLKRAVKIL